MKIDFVEIYKKLARDGDKSASRQLMVDSLHAIKEANFTNEEVQEFLIQAFEDILKDVSPKKALYLTSGISGKHKTADVKKHYDIGSEIASCHRTRIEGKTKGVMRKTPLDKCCEEASREHNISFDTARKYYKLFLEIEKATQP